MDRSAGLLEFLLRCDNQQQIRRLGGTGHKAIAGKEGGTISDEDHGEEGQLLSQVGYQSRS